jgi:hypothetical protein
VNLDGVLSAIIEPASLAQEVQGLRHVLSDSKEACHTYFARIISSLDVQLSRVSISDISMLNNIKFDLGIKSKSMSKDAAADWKKKEKSVKSWIDAQKRRQSATNAKADADSRTPNFTKMFEIHEATEALTDGSVFEAKAGGRAARVPPFQGKDPVGAVSNLPLCKTAAKAMKTHLATHEWGTIPITESPQVKKVMKKLADAYDPTLFTSLPLPSVQPWASKVYGFEWFGSKAGFYNVSVPPFCAMECRMVFVGAEVVFGIGIDEVPGTSTKDKRSWLHNAAKADLGTLIKDKGWLLQHDGTSLVMIPSGVITVVISTEEVFGLRWSVSSDVQDTARVKRSLSMLLDSFPEMKNASFGYYSFLQYLEADC